MDAISHSRSDNVYSFLVSLFVNLGKFVSFRFKQTLLILDCHTFRPISPTYFLNASVGLLAFAILILCTCLVESGPSISTVGLILPLG